MNMTKLILLASGLTMASVSFAQDGKKMSADAQKIHNAVKRISKDHNQPMKHYHVDFTELNKMDCAEGGWGSIACNATINSACMQLDSFIAEFQLSDVSCKEMRAAMEICLADPYLVSPHVDSSDRYLAHYAVALKDAGCKLKN